MGTFFVKEVVWPVPRCGCILKTEQKIFSHLKFETTPPLTSVVQSFMKRLVKYTSFVARQRRLTNGNIDCLSSLTIETLLHG